MVLDDLFIECSIGKVNSDVLELNKTSVNKRRHLCDGMTLIEVREKY